MYIRFINICRYGGNIVLKKLAKYGNSTTLVIDKAILELLNMDESSIVKLHTDGKSLIITPVESQEENKKVSYAGDEALNVAAGIMHKKNMVKNLDTKSPEFLTASQEFQKVFAKHQHIFQKLSHEIALKPDFQEAAAKLAQAVDPVTQSEEYLKEYKKIQAQFCPEAQEFFDEIDAAYKKCNQLK